MATTTNYSWTTPDDTSLVKDGAAAIRSLGTSIDTTTKALNPSTTLGDIEYRSSTANTNTRLGIGTSGQVLSVSGGVPAWTTPAGGGGMTLLSTTSLSGSSTAITSISGSYKNLYVEYEGVFCSGTASLRLRPNGSSSTIYYDATKSAQTSSLATSTSVSLALDIPSTSGTQNWGYFYINDYADAEHWKFIDNYSLVESTDGATYVRVFPSYGYWRSTSAITSLTFLLSSGTFSGGTVRVYGVN